MALTTSHARQFYSGATADQPTLSAGAAGALFWCTSDTTLYVWDGSSWSTVGGGGSGGGDPAWFVDGTLAVLTNVGMTWVAPRACTVVEVILHVRGKGSASSTVIDVNKNGTSIFPTSTKPTVAYNDADGIDTRTPDTTSVALGDTLTVDIDAIATGAEGMTAIVVLGGAEDATAAANNVADGRLTLTSATPVTTADVTAATTLYYTPYIGNRIALWSGSIWVITTFTEKSLSLSGYAANTPFDIWGYLSSGALALESLAWTNTTTRATALAYQDGVLVKSGDATRRYLGTILTTGTIGQCEDSLTKRYVYNYYNRKLRQLYRVNSGANHSYTTGSWRYWNNDSTNILEMIVGVVEDAIHSWGTVEFQSGGGGRFGLLLNNIAGTAGSTWSVVKYTNVSWSHGTGGSWTPRLGYNYIAHAEIGTSNTTFWSYFASAEALL